MRQIEKFCETYNWSLEREDNRLPLFRLTKGKDTILIAKNKYALWDIWQTEKFHTNLTGRGKVIYRKLEEHTNPQID